MSNYSALDIEKTIYIHEQIIEHVGGKQGIRDYNLLHSALERCKSTFAGQDLYPITPEKASALMHSMTNNHPFLDGNKRTAYAIMVRFLETNNYHLQVTQQEIVDFCLNIAHHNWKVSVINQWLQSHVTKRAV